MRLMMKEVFRMTEQKQKAEDKEEKDEDEDLWEKFGASYADDRASTLTSWKRSG